MGDDEELPPLSVQPRGSDGGPAGAQHYDDTASMLLAARQGPDALARHLEQARGYQFDEGYNGVQGGELPAVGEGPDEPEQPAMQQPSDYQAQLAALQARIERNQQMQEQGVNAAFERSRPSESEKWLSLAAALASPTQTGSLGETMGNVFQSLAGYKRGVRQAESTRQSELARLRQAYDLAGINATVRGMKPRTAASLAFDTLGQARNKATGELMADSKGRPVVRNNEDYLRLSAGSEFVDINGNIRRKPGG